MDTDDKIAARFMGSVMFALILVLGSCEADQYFKHAEKMEELRHKPCQDKPLNADQVWMNACRECFKK